MFQRTNTETYNPNPHIPALFPKLVYATPVLIIWSTTLYFNNSYTFNIYLQLIKFDKLKNIQFLQLS
jgi:hypothetical protein